MFSWFQLLYGTLTLELLSCWAVLLRVQRGVEYMLNYRLLLRCPGIFFTRVGMYVFCISNSGQ